MVWSRWTSRVISEGTHIATLAIHKDLTGQADLRVLAQVSEHFVSCAPATKLLSKDAQMVSSPNGQWLGSRNAARSLLESRIDSVRLPFSCLVQKPELLASKEMVVAVRLDLVIQFSLLCLTLLWMEQPKPSLRHPRKLQQRLQWLLLGRNLNC